MPRIVLLAVDLRVDVDPPSKRSKRATSLSSSAQSCGMCPRQVIFHRSSGPRRLMWRPGRSYRCDSSAEPRTRIVPMSRRHTLVLHTPDTPPSSPRSLFLAVTVQDGQLSSTLDPTAADDGGSLQGFVVHCTAPCIKTHIAQGN